MAERVVRVLVKADDQYISDCAAMGVTLTEEDWKMGLVERLRGNWATGMEWAEVVLEFIEFEEVVE